MGQPEAYEARDADGDSRRGARRNLRSEVFSTARDAGRRELHHHRRVHRFQLGCSLDTRLSGAPHSGAGTTDYAVLALRAVSPALAGGRAALASAVGAERRSFFAAYSSACARRAVRLACSRTPRALSWASSALS